MFKICVPRYIIFTVLQSIQIITYEPSYCKFDLSMQERTRCRQQRKQSPVQGIYLVWARKYIFSLKHCDHFLEIFAFQAKFLSFFCNLFEYIAKFEPTFAIYYAMGQNLFFTIEQSIWQSGQTAHKRTSSTGHLTKYGASHMQASER